MKTIGQYLRDARKEKGLSVKELSDITKIRESFLRALEGERWQALPEFSVVSGFTKSVAGALELDRGQMVAVLRRDYPPKKTSVLPKPEMRKEFRVGPQLVFFLGVGTVVVGIIIYLATQYLSFIRPPSLIVDMPTESQVVFENQLTVLGTTDPSSTVIVNAQPALVEEDGDFSTTIVINKDTTVVEVVATSRAGKETRVTRTIKPEL